MTCLSGSLPFSVNSFRPIAFQYAQAQDLIRQAFLGFEGFCSEATPSSKMTETSPLSSVSKRQGGPEAPNQLFADRYPLIAPVWARKAPRV